MDWVCQPIGDGLHRWPSSMATRSQSPKTNFIASSLSLHICLLSVFGVPQKLHFVLSPQGNFKVDCIPVESGGLSFLKSAIRNPKSEIEKKINQGCFCSFLFVFPPGKMGWTIVIGSFRVRCKMPSTPAPTAIGGRGRTLGSSKSPLA